MAINGKGRPTKAQKEESARVQKWITCIADYEKEFEPWCRRVESILRRYRDDSRRDANNPSAKFNILWSNVQTLVPATFNRLPQPDVSRRFRDNDPVGRVASMIVERALDFEVQHYPDYRETMKESVYDRFLGGRGTAWARYEPHILALGTDEPVDGVQITEDIDEPEETLDYECAPTDYVHWKDFGHTKARTWEEVTAVWRCVYLTREACVERFGEELGSQIPLDSSPEEKPGSYKTEGGEDKNRAAIYEIWNKEDKTALWISKAMKKILDEKSDPLELEGFFPCPRPLYATLTSDNLIPVPDFVLYQDQANTLDVLCDRIDGLCRMLQVKGVHDGSIKELARLFTEGTNGTLIGISNWAAFTEKNGLKGAIDVYDITPIFNALREAFGAMEQQKQQVYEITGISDIVRGQTQASETLGAQEIKRNFVGLRLGSYKEQVALYATELLRLKAQIICTKFDPMTILKMAAAEQLEPEDQQLIPQAMALIKNEPLRNFRIDIAADTLVQMDEQQEQESRVSFLAAIGTYMDKCVQALSVAGPAAPALAPLLMKLLKFGATGFKIGKQVEGAIDAAADQIAKIAAQPQQPKPDPEMLKIQAEQQRSQMQLQADQQREAAQMQATQATEQAKIQSEAQLEQLRQAAEEQRHIRELEAQGALDIRKAQIQQDTQLKQAALQVAGQIEVARINAEAKERSDALKAQTDAETAQVQAQVDAEAGATAERAGDETRSIMQKLMQTQQELLATIAAPREAVRDANGRLVGMRVVK